MQANKFLEIKISFLPRGIPNCAKVMNSYILRDLVHNVRFHPKSASPHLLSYNIAIGDKPGINL